MKLKRKHRRQKEQFFLVVLFAYIVIAILKSSILNYQLHSFIFKTANCGVFLCLLFLLFLMNYSKKYILIMCLCAGVLSAMAFFNNSYLSLIIILLFVLESKMTDFESILKYIAFGLIFATLIVVLLFLLKILPDYTYIHRIGNAVRIAHSCGFKYYSTLGYISMTLTGIYLYLHKNVSSITLIVLALLNYLMFIIETTQLALVLTAVIIIAYVLTRKINVFRFNNRFWRWGSFAIPWLLCIGTLAVVQLYKNDILLLPSAFSTLTSRLNYSNIALNTYGISLFGTKVEMYGNTLKYYRNAPSAFYIDSGYIYSCIAYGVLFTALILLLYSLIYRYLSKNNDAFLFIWLSAILTACVVNNFLVNICYNPLLFLLPYALKNTNIKRTNKCNFGETTRQI